jgi:FkbM family methyltransferase
MNHIKQLLNFLSPNLSRYLRNKKIKKILNSAPQVSQDGNMRFWGAIPYENYEPAVTDILMKYIKESNVFINIGANSGVYCLKMSPFVDRIYAFEPLKDNLNLLFKNINQNNLTEKIVVFPVAVGSKESLVKFYGASTGGSLLRGWNSQFDDGQDLQAFSLDFLLYDKLLNRKSLFLIDVEGAEFEVIKGAKNIVRDSDSIFCIEIPCRQFMPDDKFNKNFQNIFKFFDENNYDFWDITDNGKIYPLDINIINNIISSEKYDGVMALFKKKVDLHTPVAVPLDIVSIF